MSATAEKGSEVEILSEVIHPDAPDLAVAHARWLLSLRFTEKQEIRMTELGDKANEGSLGAREEDELDRFLRVGMFLNLLRAKAELSLRQVSAGGLDGNRFGPAKNRSGSGRRRLRILPPSRGGRRPSFLHRSCHSTKTWWCYHR